MGERKHSRRKMVSSLKDTLVSLPKRDRKSFLRGWLQVDKVFEGSQRKRKAALKKVTEED